MLNVIGIYVAKTATKSFILCLSKMQRNNIISINGTLKTSRFPPTGIEFLAEMSVKAQISAQKMRLVGKTNNTFETLINKENIHIQPSNMQSTTCNYIILVHTVLNRVFFE
jgi:aspartyl/asparaginyl-tRNA synthetase